MVDLVAGLIDVFADQPLTGNPLAVVEDADELSEIQMRRIAGEFNQAETTFIMRSHRADRKLRSFTASGAEVVGAGHNALGAWLWLAEQGKLGTLRSPSTFPAGDRRRCLADRNDDRQRTHRWRNAAGASQTIASAE